MSSDSNTNIDARLPTISLAWELMQAGLRVDRQLTLPIHYKSNELATPLKLDLMVDNRIKNGFYRVVNHL